VLRWSFYTNGGLAGSIEHVDFGWFDFPLTRRRILRQNGSSSLESLLRFPEGEAQERSFFRIVKKVRDEQDSWLLFHPFVQLAHLLGSERLLFRLRIIVNFGIKPYLHNGDGSMPDRSRPDASSNDLLDKGFVPSGRAVYSIFASEESLQEEVNLRNQEVELMPLLYVLLGMLLGAILVPLLFILGIVVYALLKFTLLQRTGTRIVATVVRLEPNKYATKLNRVILQWQQPHTGKIFTYRGTTRHPERFPLGNAIPLLIVPSHPQWYAPTDEYQRVLHPV